MGEPEPMSVGRRLRLRRQTLKVSQQRLADEVGVSAQAISLIEAGHREPSLQLLVRLHQALGVSTDYLLTGRESPPVSVAGAIRSQPDLTASAKRTLIDMVSELRSKAEGS